MYHIDDSPGVALAMQTLAREQMVRHLLEDVRLDITISRLEGWNWRPYVERIRDEMDKILKGDDNDGQGNVL
ncbi:MAG: hypothetical protein LUF28_05510 [Clostridiales bacterium]|nr:hypothetical protein [Clostridiales bacterium]